jgi:hypothetical protein
MRIAVDLAVAEVVLVGEISLESQMVTALTAFEALLVEDDLVDWSDLLRLVDALLTPGALVGGRRNEQSTKTFWRSVGHRYGRGLLLGNGGRCHTCQITCSAA